MLQNHTAIGRSMMVIFGFEFWTLFNWIRWNSWTRSEIQNAQFICCLSNMNFLKFWITISIGVKLDPNQTNFVLLMHILLKYIVNLWYYVVRELCIYLVEFRQKCLCIVVWWLYWYMYLKINSCKLDFHLLYSFHDCIPWSR